MFWNKSSDKSKDAKDAKDVKDVSDDSKTEAVPGLFSKTRAGSGKGGAQGKTGEFESDKLPAFEKLPSRLQNMVDEEDREDSFYDDVVSGYASESTESSVRYAAYATRLRTILTSAHRYVAYTSDIGESFRPVAHPVLVRAAYGISWSYILGDVGYEGYKAYWQNQRVLHPDLHLTPRQSRAAHMAQDPQRALATLTPGVVAPLDDWRTVMAQRAIFQSIASMGLPALTIHSVVRYSGQAMKNLKNKTVRTWGPIGLGLAVVPFLPSLFDKPVENAVEYVFHKGFATVGGQQAVGDAPVVGREKQLSKKPGKEKEL